VFAQKTTTHTPMMAENKVQPRMPALSRDEYPKRRGTAIGIMRASRASFAAAGLDIRLRPSY
jgi:hypothetical protein